MHYALLSVTLLGRLTLKMTLCLIVRILHDWEIANDKALVVKVDPKTKGVLDEYKRQRVKEMTGKSPPKKEEGADGDKVLNDILSQF